MGLWGSMRCERVSSIGISMHILIDGNDYLETSRRLISIVVWCCVVLQVDDVIYRRSSTPPELTTSRRLITVNRHIARA